MILLCAVTLLSVSAFLTSDKHIRDLNRSKANHYGHLSTYHPSSTSPAGRDMGALRTLVDDNGIVDESLDITDTCPVDGLCMDSCYNENSQCQAYCASLLASYIQRAAEKVNADLELPEDQPFKIAEYGCATDGSSNLPLSTIQDCIGSRHLHANMVISFLFLLRYPFYTNTTLILFYNSLYVYVPG